MNQLELQLKAHHLQNDPLGYLIVEAQIDDKPIADFGELAIDLHQFQRSSENDGEFFILTCWCGDPSCANIEHGIQVHHDSNNVQWRAKFGDDSQSYIFEKQAYLDAHQNLRRQAKELLDSLGMVNDGELTIVPIRNRPYLKL